jgi:hypothetical protein
MAEGVIQRSFSAGELSPSLYARADLARYIAGLRTAHNWWIESEGGASNRAGFGFVEQCKTNDEGIRLMPFVPPTGNGFAIEIGSGYFRFYRNGGPVVVTSASAWSSLTAYVPGDIVSNDGAFWHAHTANTNEEPGSSADASWHELPDGVLEIPTPYSLAQIPDWNQSGSIVTLTHPEQAPRELVYVSTTRWFLRTVTTGAGISAPANVAGTPASGGSSGAASQDWRFVVTAAHEDTFEESIASSVETVNSITPTQADPIALAWDAQGDAAEFYVYADPFGNGVFGYVGTAATNSFNYAGQDPDFGLTPPIARSLFNSPDGFPSHSAVHQQRRLFANTNDEPDAVYGSRVGFPNNFQISSPLQDDDAITFRIAGNNNHAVQAMRSLKAGLVVLTKGGEWTVGRPGVPLTPASITPDQETYVGIAENVRPVVVGNSIIYAQQRANILRDLSFDQAVEGLAGRDLTIFARHLFKQRKTLERVDYQQVPHSIVWCVRSDGVLLGLTYVKDQDVVAWHRHTTGASGLFEDVCVVPETNEDALYVIVSRLIDGERRRYVERLESRDIRSEFFSTDAFFVDSGLTYSGSPADLVTGLENLEGEIVAVLGDGEVVFDGDPTKQEAENFRVSNGALALPASYSVIHVGLPIPTPDLETLDLDVQGAALRDKRKRVAQLNLLVERSSRTFRAGPDSDSLQPYDPSIGEGDSVEFTGQVEMQLTSYFGQYGRILVRQTDPLPISISGVIPIFEVGG